MKVGYKFIKVDDSNFVSVQTESLGQNIKNIRLHLGLNMEEFGKLILGANKGLDQDGKAINLFRIVNDFTQLLNYVRFQLTN